MRKFLILISLLFVFETIFAQDNPFLSKEKPGTEKKGRKTGFHYPVFMQKIMAKIGRLQRSLNKNLSTLTKKLKETKSIKLMLLIMFVTFIYGAVHALGPGHGKALTFSYFLSEETNIKKGITVGCIIGFMHAFSALFLVLLLYFTIKKAYLNNIEDMSRTIKLISYALIAGIGLFLLSKKAYDIKKGRDSEDKGIEVQNTQSIIPFAFAVGLIPCTGSTIILLFTLSLGVLKIGIISIIFMALGMAFTISTVGILTILAKDRVKKIFSGNRKKYYLFKNVVSILGAFLIFVLGAVLFLGVYLV
jgi:ABC-type nickel/cobalt efflux system permease component RcnA